MIGALVAAGAYLISFICYGFALLLFLEWVSHTLPGSGLNQVRKALFLVSFPFLSFGERYLAFEFGSFRSRGLLPAVVLLIAARYGVPWLVLVSFDLRG